MKDTANELAPLDECLKSTINRAKIAQMLYQQSREDLLYTALEDLAKGVQDITDEYCVVR